MWNLTKKYLKKTILKDVFKIFQEYYLNIPK
jgi:hypothetical protein